MSDWNPRIAQCRNLAVEGELNVENVERFLGGSMYLDPYLNYRQEIGREHALLSNRINSLQTSQAFFLAAWALLFGSRPLPVMALVFLAVAAFLISAVGLVVIDLNCQLINRWRAFARDRMISPDKEQATPELTLYHLDRPYQDWTNRLAVGVFPRALPLIFRFLWLGLLLFIALIHRVN